MATELTARALAGARRRSPTARCCWSSRPRWRRRSRSTAPSTPAACSIPPICRASATWSAACSTAAACADPPSAIAEELDDRGVALRVTTTRHRLSVSCTCLSEDFADVLAILLDVARRPAFPDERDRASARPRPSPRCGRTTTTRRCGALDAVAELIYGADHPYGAEGQGHAARRSSGSGAPTCSRSTPRWVRPRRLTLAIVGDVEPAAAIDAGRGGARGLAAPPAEHVPVTPPAAPRGRRIASSRDARQVPGGHRLRLQHHPPPRSALLRLLDDEQRPRAVRPRRAAGRQHPRAAGHGLLRLQHLRRRASAKDR